MYSDDVTADVDHLHVKRIYLAHVSFHEKQSHCVFNPRMDLVSP
jgi:hypothetical protein